MSSAALIQTAIALVIVLAVALALGFDPNAGPLDWLALAGLLTLVTLAVTWLAVAFGLVTDNVETASNLPLLLFLLPFLGSGFVPTDSMPAAMRWFAENQPFTPIMETVRGLLHGHPDRQQRRARRRLVGRRRLRRLPVGEAALQPS